MTVDAACAPTPSLGNVRGESVVVVIDDVVPRAGGALFLVACVGQRRRTGPVSIEMVDEWGNGSVNFLAGRGRVGRFTEEGVVDIGHVRSVRLDGGRSRSRGTQQAADDDENDDEELREVLLL